MGAHIDTDADGFIYLGDGSWSPNMAHAVIKYGPSGNHLTNFGEWKKESWEPGTFYWQLNGLAVSRDGSKIYTVEGGNNRVQVFARQGNGSYAYSSQFGQSSGDYDSRHHNTCYTQGDIGKFLSPYDIGFDGAGNIYVLNTTCNEVVKFDSSKRLVHTSGVLGGNLPHAFAVAHNGDVYIGQSGKWMDNLNADGGGGANTAPTITNVEPAEGASVADGKPLIKAKVSDAEQNLVEANTKLFLNGVEIPVERRAYDEATDTLSHAYDGAQPLVAGNHTIKVEASDGLAATPTVKTWTFNVPGTESTPVECHKWASSSGSDDTGTGEKASPVGTVRTLANKLQPGQTGCLKAGETFHMISGWGTINKSGEAGKPITIRSDPAGRAIITGQIQVDGSHVTLTDINFRGLAGAGERANHILVEGGDNVSILDNDITSPKGICISVGDIDSFVPEDQQLMNSSKNFVLDGNRIYGCGVDSYLEPAMSGVHGIYLAYTEDARITNNYIYDNRVRGLQLYSRAERTLIEHNVLDGNSGNLNIGGSSHESGYYVSRDNTIKNNIISNSTFAWHKDQYQVFGNYKTTATPDEYNNLVTDNCIYHGDSSKNFGGTGIKQANNKFDNPMYVNQQGNNFALQADSPCAGKGPQPKGGDTTAPTIADMLPANGSSTTETRPRLSATVKDDAPLDKNNIQLRVDGNLIGNNHYAYFPDTGSLWREFEQEDVSFPYGTHKVEITVTDAQGKTTSQTSTFEVVDPNVDTTAPTGTITIKGGDDYTNVLGVTLTLNAADNAGGTGVKEMRFWNESNAWTEWEPYNTTKAWTLRNVQGSQNVHAQFRDGNSNASVAAVDDIKLDTVKPKVSGVLPGSTNRVWIGTNAVAYFPAAENIPLGNLNQNTFYLRIKGTTTTTKVAVTYRYDETQATDRAILKPLKSLQRNKTYQVVMTGGLKDAAGNALDQDPNTAGFQGKVWYFTTQMLTGTSGCRPSGAAPRFSWGTDAEPSPNRS
jgi:parallel beta-helix repeat protein